MSEGYTHSNLDSEGWPFRNTKYIAQVTEPNDMMMIKCRHLTGEYQLTQGGSVEASTTKDSVVSVNLEERPEPVIDTRIAGKRPRGILGCVG